MAKKKLVYPLEQVLEIKIRRLEQAEKVYKEKQRILETEQKKLLEYQQAYQTVVDHHQEKLIQLREALDQGTPSHKIEQIRTYIKEVKTKMYEEKRKVERQEKQVEKAEKAVEDAKKVVNEKRLEVDKLQTHKQDWLNQENKLIMKQEAKNLDEIGSLVYLSNKRREKEEEKNKHKRDKND